MRDGGRDLGRTGAESGAGDELHPATPRRVRLVSDALDADRRFLRGEVAVGGWRVRAGTRNLQVVTRLGW
jgi:hypothetical protein